MDICDNYFDQFRFGEDNYPEEEYHKEKLEQYYFSKIFPPVLKRKLSSNSLKDDINKEEKNQNQKMDFEEDFDVKTSSIKSTQEVSHRKNTISDLISHETIQEYKEDESNLNCKVLLVWLK